MKLTGVAGRLNALAPDRRALRRDAVAGVPGAIASVPDGMASAVLVGISPIHGLYAGFLGPIAGGLSQGTRLMIVTTTTAAALAAGSALGGVDPSERSDAVFLLTIVSGAAMVAAGLARLGRFTRFVSLSVMTGFLTGVAANILFGQLADLAGATAHGSFALAKALDVLLHPGRIDAPSLLTGLAALALAFGCARTRLAMFAPVIAIVVPTIFTLGVDGIARVQDSGAIPRSLPSVHVPDLGLLSFDLVTGALAVAAIVLVQGAGVSEAAPNPGGERASASRDFIAQGIANVASGLFRGQPVGGSVGQTALNVASGARSRWASVFAGVWVLVIVVVFARVVGRIPMPTLAAVLMFAAVGSLRTGAIKTIARTGLASLIALVATFVATLLLSVPAAVGIGVALSLMLQLNKEALDLKVVELVPVENGRLEERPVPRILPSRRVTLLEVYGSLYYAGARTLAARLPEPASADRPVVVLRLRGRTALGATSFATLDTYAERLEAAGGRLFLSGVDPALLERFRAALRGDDRGSIRLFPATRGIGDASIESYRAGERWLAKQPSSGETQG